MKVSSLKNLFRAEVDDLVEPYLWSDTEFYAYLNEAQDLFVRAIGGIPDRRSPLTRISYKAGDQFKKYDPRIIRIKGAYDADNRIIRIRNFDNMESLYSDDDYGRYFHKGIDDSQSGTLSFLITDVEQNQFQLYPKPNADGQIQLFVYRRPLEEIDCADVELEIESQYHIPLLNWVKYRMFMKQDVETFDGSKATQFRVAFDEDVKRAKKDKSAREDRKRVVAYGGI